MTILPLEKVYDAKKVLSEIARKTDVIHSNYLSEKNNVYLKTENLQLTGSFKLRGAYYKISKLTPEQKAKGIIACSAGNHAQGVALAAKKIILKQQFLFRQLLQYQKLKQQGAMELILN